jgi:hypothetical protein
MTKKILAKTIVEMIDNFRDVGDTETDVVAAVESLLDTLQPKEPKRFSKWGQPHEQSTVEECWK